MDLRAMARRLWERIPDDRRRRLAETPAARALHRHLWVRPGHYYSPYADLRFVNDQADRLFAPDRADVPGVDLRDGAQLALLRAFEPLYDSLGLPEHPAPGHRYWLGNERFSWTDGIVLACMLRHLQPKRLVEIGSGFSSLLVRDVTDHFLDGAMNVTIVDPYPEPVLGDVPSGCTLLTAPVQDVPLDPFLALGDGDVLLVDSSHVAKVGSDVNHLVFEVLPLLASGVHVHFHDVHWPFEYPREWVLEGRAWSEAYLLRAFLQFNAAFEVVLWPSYLIARHRGYFAERMPLCLRNPGGSIWIRRRAAG